MRSTPPLGRCLSAFQPFPTEPQGVLFKTRVMRKRKATDSGLRDIEVVDALHTLTDVRDVLLREQRQEEEAETRGDEGTGSGGGGTGEAVEGPTTESVLEKLGDLISVLEAKVEGSHVSNSAAFEPMSDPPRQSISFSNVTFEILIDKLNVVPQDDLVEKGNHATRAAESAARGGDEYMSSKNMYSHLNLLQNLVPRTVSVVFQHRVSPLKRRHRTRRTPAFG